MANLGTLIMKIGSDISGFQQGLAEANANLRSFASSATKTGGILTLGVTAPILAVGKASLDMAMEAIESENLFKESMGEMADSTRAWSMEIQKSMGLNGYELRKNVALFNTMTTAAGLTEKAALDLSKGTVMLSHDMASFFNVSQGDALNDLKAIVTGESEPLKKYGILMSENAVKAIAYTQGIARQGEKLTDVQKIQARYALALQSTSKAQGDLARTIDSPTNKLRVLKEQLALVQTEFGMKLIPVLLLFLETIKPVVDWLINLTDAQMTVIIGLAGLLAAVGPVTTAIGLLSGAVSFLLSPIGLAIAAILAIVTAIFGWSNVVSTFQTILSGLGLFMSQVLVGDFQGAWETLNNLMTTLFGPEVAAVIMANLTAIGTFIGTSLETIKTLVSAGLTVISTFWTNHGTAITLYLTTLWTGIVTTFTTWFGTLSELVMGCLASIQTFWLENGDSIMRILILWWTAVYETWSTYFEILVKLITDVWNGIAKIIEGILDVILGVMGIFISAIDGDWRSVWNNMGQVVGGAAKIISGIWEILVGALEASVKMLGTIVEGIITGIFNAILNFIVNTVNSAINSMNSLISMFNSLISSITGGAIKTAVNLIPTIGSQTLGTQPIVPTNNGSSGSGSTTVHTAVYLDGKKISDAVDQKLGTKVAMMAN